jgi:hypothetical protein
LITLDGQMVATLTTRLVISAICKKVNAEDTKYTVCAQPLHLSRA